MDISEKVLAPMFGCKSLSQYYDETQSAGRLNKIKIPTLFFNALDDPCINAETYPYKEYESNDLVMAIFTNRGGHCSHITGNFRPIQWFPALFLEFLDFVEKKKNKMP